MTALAIINKEFRKLGYGANSIAKNYKFSDLLSEGSPTREVAVKSTS